MGIADKLHGIRKMEGLKNDGQTNVTERHFLNRCNGGTEDLVKACIYSNNSLRVVYEPCTSRGKVVVQLISCIFLIFIISCVVCHVRSMDAVHGEEHKSANGNEDHLEVSHVNANMVGI